MRFELFWKNGMTSQVEGNGIADAFTKQGYKKSDMEKLSHYTQIVTSERPSKEKQNEIIPKLQKLLALATSPNEHEAKLAMEKAVDLMEKYSLSMSDVEEQNGRTINEKLTNVSIGGMGARKVSWETVLAGSIARTFDSEVVIHNYRVYDSMNKSNSEWGFSFLGFKADVEMAIWLHKYVRRSVHKLAHKYKNIADRNTFAHGMVSSIHTRLQSMYKKRNEVTDCKALVVVKGNAVKKYMKEQFPKLLKGAKYTMSGSRDAWSNGIEAGNKIGLAKPLNGTSSVKQLN